MVPPQNARIGATNVSPPGHSLPESDLRLYSDIASGLIYILVPKGATRSCSLLGGLSYDRKLLPKLTKRAQRLTALMKRRASL